MHMVTIVYSRTFIDFVYIFGLSCYLFILFNEINLTGYEPSSTIDSKLHHVNRPASYG